MNLKSFLKDNRVESISDEHENDDGYWIYLKDNYRDIHHDPLSPTKAIHEYYIPDLVTRMQGVAEVK